MLQCGYLIAQTVVGKGAEIIPAGIPSGGIGKCIQSLLIAAEADVVLRSFLIIITAARIGIAALLVTAESAEGIVLAVSAAIAAVTAVIAVSTALLAVFLRILDLVVSGIDLLHFLCGNLISGIQVRMVLLCQFPVSSFDFLVGCIGADPKYLVRIVDHVSSLAFAPFPLKLHHTPL